MIGLLRIFKYVRKRLIKLSLENKMLDNSRCDYNDPNGPIFVSVGTGGHSHIHLKDKFSTHTIFS